MLANSNHLSACKLRDIQNSCVKSIWVYCSKNMLFPAFAAYYYCKQQNTPQPPKTLCPPQGTSFRPLYGYKHSIFLWVTCSYRKERSLKSAASSPFQREMPLFKASQPSYSFPLKAAALKADITCYLTPGKESTY